MLYISSYKTSFVSTNIYVTTILLYILVQYTSGRVSEEKNLLFFSVPLLWREYGGVDCTSPCFSVFVHVMPNQRVFFICPPVAASSFYSFSIHFKLYTRLFYTIIFSDDVIKRRRHYFSVFVDKLNLMLSWHNLAAFVLCSAHNTLIVRPSI